MNEEEEKIIRQVKIMLDNVTPFDMSPSRYNALETMVNLIEKQQKGIEIHKENFKSLSEDITQVLKELGLSEETIIADEMVIEIKKRFVSKDKIKDKIKELEEELDEFEKTDNSGRFKREKSRDYDKVEVLQELLEE